MTRTKWLLGFVIGTSAAACAAEAAALDSLALRHVYRIDGPPRLEPSGLAYCNGQLLMVSDKHNAKIFQLDRAGDTAYAVVNRELKDIPPPREITLPWLHRAQNWSAEHLFNVRYDWEGITCDPAGALYLVSETFGQVLQVDANGAMRWLDAPLYESAHAQGMLQRFNAFFEGIQWTAVGLLLAAEREERGLVEVQNEPAPRPVRAVSVAPSGLPHPTTHKRTSDFSGLAAANGKLYTLERNDSAVCRRARDNFAIEQCWSYAFAENNPDHVYKDTSYGQAEGLEIVGDALFVVIDNNGQPRRAAPMDVRPVLFEFVFPDANPAR